MADGIVRAQAAWPGGGAAAAAAFGEVACKGKEVPANVLREDERSWARSALRSVIVRLRLQCFFLVLPEKAVVRLCEAEDSGGPKSPWNCSKKPVQMDLDALRSVIVRLRLQCFFLVLPEKAVVRLCEAEDSGGPKSPWNCSKKPVQMDLDALRSVIVRLRLQCFFLVLPEKAVVRLCEAEDSGGPKSPWNCSKKPVQMDLDALRSVIVRLRLQCFFLVLPEKAVVRLCEAEDSGGPKSPWNCSKKPVQMDLDALRSVIVRLRLQCFFLVLPEKAVVRLCEAEDSGGPKSPWNCSKKPVQMDLDALRSVIVRLRLQCFFLVLPEKAVVRLCEAEDSGGPLLGRVMVVGKKCAANLDLTNGFRMAVNAHPRALRAVVYIYVFWVAVSWAGLLAKVFAPQASLHAYGSPPSRFHMLPVNLAPVDV
ncbi:uncharacterized protein [Anser cygnoides]|uniref:uncharacterized protein isoform X6 n=1 Tax=Anser cygnoides TaxID=8845 RepID=UPI0034D2128D